MTPREKKVRKREPRHVIRVTPNMTDEQIVQAAMDILGGFQEDIKLMLKHTQSERDNRELRMLEQNKEARKRLKRVAKALRTLCEELPDLPLNLLSNTGLDRTPCFHLKDKCEHYLAINPSRPKPEAFEKRLAAQAAWCLIGNCHKTLTMKADDAFRRLAPILYGNREADLERYCRELGGTMVGTASGTGTVSRTLVPSDVNPGPKVF